MIIALASPRVATSMEDGLEKVRQCLSEAAAQGAEIVCFPEAYLPGLRGQDFEVLPFDQAQQERVLETVTKWAWKYHVTTILGMERLTEAGRQIVAVVFDAQGHIQGVQTKNQIDPTEDRFYVPGTTRQLFEVNGVKFGVAICHEGWRYPETVRWAAARGARIVFHPQHTGNEQEGVLLTQWGAAEAPYYEKAMMMRSIENTIYFASVNYALRFQESATSLIDPSGRCQAYLPYGQEGVLVQEIDIEKATGLLAARYAPERYRMQRRRIPGLEVGEDVEERIWSAFGRWSGRFKSKLASEGVPQLIDRYRRLIESVETQSCPHGPGGSRLTGRDWQYCCGITYEFANDLSCRDALRVIEDVAPSEATSSFRREVAALDDRLYALYEDPPARTGAWWNESYPRGIIDTGPLDMVGTWVTAPSKKHGGAVDELCLRKDWTFTGRCGRPDCVLEGEGTWAVVDGSLEFTTESGKTRVGWWYRIGELLLYFGEDRDKMVRYFPRD